MSERVQLVLILTVMVISIAHSAKGCEQIQMEDLKSQLEVRQFCVETCGRNGVSKIGISQGGICECK